jgi:hypothetical protein
VSPKLSKDVYVLLVAATSFNETDSTLICENFDVIDGGLVELDKFR